MLTNNKVLLNAGDASGNLTSDAGYLDQMLGCAIQAVFTGSPVGTIKLQGSCDAGSTSPLNPADGLGITNWTDIDGSSQAVSGAGNVVWNNALTFYKWVRVVYTRTSGTGTLTVTLNSKG